MPWVTSIVNWLKNTAIYMTGRGVLGMGIVLATTSEMIGSMAIAPLVVAGTAGLQVFIGWRNERREERKLLSAYRDEVGAKLGVDPHSVTIEHLHEVADGNPQKNIESNSVIKQVLDHNSKRGLMQIATSAGAAALLLGGFALTFGLMGFDISNIGQAITEFYNKYIPGMETFSKNKIPQIVGTTFIAGYGMSVINKTLDFVGARVLDIHRPTSHSLIQSLGRERANKKMISEEVVFGVFVSADAGLAECIEEEFGKSYEKLNPRQQYLALQQFGRGLPTARLTYELNHYMIDPEELAFAVVGQESGVPKSRDVDLREEADKEVGVRDLLQEVKKEVVGDRPQAPEEEKSAALESETPDKPANDNQQDFAARYVPRETETTKSFAERYAPDHKPDPEVISQVERLKARLETVQNLCDPSR